MHPDPQHYILGFMLGETRLTAGWKPVVRDVVLRSPDEYRWHRTDRPPQRFTGSGRRCPEPAGGAR